MASSKTSTLQFATDYVTDFVINQGHGVKGLSRTGIKTLPKQYIQPVEVRTMNKVMVGESIPIIDVSNWDDPKVMASIWDAAEKWGFFQLINHGVPLEVLDNVKAATCRFFDLPAEEKNKYSKENSSSHNVRYTTSFIPTVEKALEWKDYLSLFYVSDDEAAQLWPSSCKDEVLAYMNNSNTLVKNLLSVLLKGLNVEVDSEKEQLVTGSRRVNLNYYPVCPNPELTVGVGRHSDVSALTVLLQDDIGGLYVKVEASDSWVHVPPIKGSLIINIGDALQIFSNGRYRSIEHRVIANGSSSDRISVPLFVNPRPTDVIAPFPEVLANTGEKPIYKPILYADYCRHFYRKAHDGKATIDLAKAD